MQTHYYRAVEAAGMRPLSKQPIEFDLSYSFTKAERQSFPPGWKCRSCEGKGVGAATLTDACSWKDSVGTLVSRVSRGCLCASYNGSPMALSRGWERGLAIAGATSTVTSAASGGLALLLGISRTLLTPVGLNRKLSRTQSKFCSLNKR